MALATRKAGAGTRGVAKAAALEVIRGQTLDVGAFTGQIEPLMKREAAKDKLEFILQDERNRQLYRRVEEHLKTAERLDNMAKDMEAMKGAGRAKHETLDSLEERIMAMRKSLRVEHDFNPGKGQTAKTHKSALDEIEEELGGRPQKATTDTCPKCGKHLLPGFLAHHAQMCSGAKQVYDYENMPGEEQGGMEDERTSTLRIMRDAEARKQDMLGICPMCRRKFKRDMLKTHIPGCNDKQRLIVKQLIPKSDRVNVHASAPTPPSELQVMYTTPSTIALAWTAPVFNGGAPVLNYEIEYGHRKPLFEGKRLRGYDFVLEPTISTTRWHVSFPICAKGFTLSNLPCSTEYNGFRVRAINSCGPSDWSNVIDSASTEPPKRPSCPLHFRVLGEPTHHSVTLQWEEPLTNGGSPISGYELRYVQEVLDYGSMLSTGHTIAVKTVPHVQMIPANPTLFKLGDLRYACNYRDFVLIAINEVGQSPRSNKIETVTTADANRKLQLEYELRQARASDELTMDVMYQGFHQRFKREDYLVMLEDELRRCNDRELAKYAQDEEQEADGQKRDTAFEASQESAGKPSDDAVSDGGKTRAEGLLGAGSGLGEHDDSESAGSAKPESREDRMLRVKRDQFGYKIRKLEGEITDMQRRIDDITVKRVTLKQRLIAGDTRVQALRAELVATRNFSGDNLDSAALVGHTTRYKRSDLLRLLQKAIEEEASALASARAELMNGVRTEEKLQQSLGKAKVVLNDRRVALFKFEKQHEKRGMAIKVLFRWNNQLLNRSFNAWVDATRSGSKGRDVMRRVITRMMNSQKAGAWNQWRWYVKQCRRLDAQYALAEETGLVVGRGSKLLMKAKNHRQVTIRGVAGVMQLVDSLRDGLDQMTQGAAQIMSPPAGSGHGMMLLDKRALRKEADDGPMDAQSMKEAAQHAAAVMRWREIDALMARVLGLEGVDTALNSIRQGDSASLELMEATGSLATVSQVLGDGEVAELDGFELGMTVDETLTVIVQQGGGLVMQRQFRAAEACLRKAERAFGRAKNAFGLLQVYKRLSPMFEMEEKWERAVIHYKRMLELSRTVEDHYNTALALEGIGRGVLKRGHFKLARRSFEEACAVWMARKDFSAASRVYRCIGEANYLLGHIEQANQWQDAAAKVEKELQHRVSMGCGLLDSMQTRLQSVLVSHGTPLELEATSPMVPLIRERKQLLEEELEALKVLLETAIKFNRRESQRLDDVKDELDRVMKSGARKVKSSFLHRGNEQMFDVEVLRTKLAELVKMIEAETLEARRDTSAYNMRIENAQTALVETTDHLAAETSGLALKAFQGQWLRRVAFNGANFVVNDVLGRATGGVPQLASIIDKTAFVYRMTDGQAVNAFVGDLESVKHRPHMGHVKRATVVAFYGDRLYTGGADGTVCGWDVGMRRPYGRARKPVRVGSSANEDVEMPAPDLLTEAGRYNQSGQFAAMEGGHVGTVWSLAANSRIVASGGSDGTVVLWHARTGQRLRTLRGHTASVLSISLTDEHIVTGGADTEVRMWRYKSSNQNPARRVELVHRLMKHNFTVTCVSALSTDIVSGDRSGTVIVWDGVAGQPVRTVKVHASSVLAIQFDATKMITSSTDGTVRITDIISGSLMAVPVQDAVPPVHALQYDSHLLLCGAANHRILQFRFAGAGDRIVYKEHVLQPGESMADVGIKYNCTTAELLEWNGALSAGDMYPGQRVLVQPPVGESRATAAQTRLQQTKTMISRLEKDDKFIAARLTMPAGTIQLPIR